MWKKRVEYYQDLAKRYWDGRNCTPLSGGPATTRTASTSSLRAPVTPASGGTNQSRRLGVPLRIPFTPTALTTLLHRRSSLRVRRPPQHLPRPPSRPPTRPSKRSSKRPSKRPSIRPPTPRPPLRASPGALPQKVLLGWPIEWPSTAKWTTSVSWPWRRLRRLRRRLRHRRRRRRRRRRRHRRRHHHRSRRPKPSQRRLKPIVRVARRNFSTVVRWATNPTWPRC